MKQQPKLAATAHAVVDRTLEASDDLNRIVDYIAVDDLPAALRWLDQMRDLFVLLASSPEMGEPFNSPRFGKVRRHTQGNYVVYYRINSDGIEVLRSVTWGATKQGADISVRFGLFSSIRIRGIVLRKPQQRRF